MSKINEAITNVQEAMKQERLVLQNELLKVLNDVPSVVNAERAAWCLEQVTNSLQAEFSRDIHSDESIAWMEYLKSPKKGPQDTVDKNIQLMFSKMTELAEFVSMIPGLYERRCKSNE